MTTIPAKYTAAYHEPGRNKPCVCGSGLKFKKCCARTYSVKASQHFRNANNSGDYQNALVYARSHFTWYVLSHKAHTIPLLRADRDAAEKLLRIDIEALSELLENLHLCYYRLERSDEFLGVIQRVRNVIKDKRWDAKVAYTHGLWYLVDKHDEDGAFDALQLIDFKTCQDSDILSLYLQVCPKELSLTESIDVIDRVIVNTRRESVRLQYRSLKAIKFYLVSQNADADKMFEEAISTFDDLPEEKKSTYGKYQFAFALETYGKATNRGDILNQGLKVVRDLIYDAETEQYAAGYLADLHRLLGDCQEGLENHQDAVVAYSTSLEKKTSELTKVFLARAICNNGDNCKTRKLLESIDVSQLDEPGKFDLAISWALLAVTSLIAGDIEKAKKLLKKIETNDPAFIHLRDQWIIDLLEAKSKPDPGKVRKLVRSLNKYIILNPNFFGVGININRIIDDADSEN